MKVLIISTYDIKGGAAIAAFRLHKALRHEGIESLMLVQSKNIDHFSIIGPQSNAGKAFALLRPHVDKIFVKLYKQRTETLFNPSIVPFSNVLKEVRRLKPDIVHLHWINDGMMTIKDIAKIKVPIVWSLHDMWPFTGGCHYDEECGRYKNACGYCKVLNSKKSYDLSVWNYNQKRKYLHSANIYFVGLSRWMTKSVSLSSLHVNKPIYNIPNPINTNIFSPLEKSIARQLLNLPPYKKIVLFGAKNAINDPRKGFNELSVALNSINSDNIELVILGSENPKKSAQFKYETHYLGHLSDEISLRIVYSAADVMIVPSLQENLSNAIMESLACGTPVVAFNVGGNSDMIEHQKNGYLANPFDCLDLANGIKWVLDNEKYEELAINARKKITDEFDSRLIAKKYIELYQNVLATNKK